MQDARLYTKIMKHLEKKTGTGFWEYRTLNMVHPQLAQTIQDIINRSNGIADSHKLNLHKRYLPRRLWNYYL